MAVAIPLIAAVVGAGASIYESNKASESADAAQKAQAKLAAQQEADAKAAAAPKPETVSNYPDIAAQMKAKLAGEQAGAPGVSSDFWTQDLSQSYPGFEALAQQVVSGGPTTNTNTGGIG